MSLIIQNLDFMIFIAITKLFQDNFIKTGKQEGTQAFTASESSRVFFKVCVWIKLVV